MDTHNKQYMASRMRQLMPILALALMVCGVPREGHAEHARTGACTDATAACMESVAIEGQPKRLEIYRTYSLSRLNEDITRAFVLVHGIRRDADSHFRTGVAGAFLAGALQDTIIIAPRFASSSDVPGNEVGACHDKLAASEANWICDPKRPDTWRSGGPEVSADSLTSFDFLDALIRRLSDRKVFPKLTRIVVAGHSAGGQFVMRYAMAGAGSAPNGPDVSYIVANPSSYAYLDQFRPIGGTPQTRDSVTEFGPFPDALNCPAYNDWPYGLDHLRGYATRLNADQLRTQFSHRAVTYLLGDADVLPSGVFDASCPAMAQGSTRLDRGLAFARYMQVRFGATHKAVKVPFCSHSARCLFTADDSLPLIFP